MRLHSSFGSCFGRDLLLTNSTAIIRLSSLLRTHFIWNQWKPLSCFCCVCVGWCLVEVAKMIDHWDARLSGWRCHSSSFIYPWHCMGGRILKKWMVAQASPQLPKLCFYSKWSWCHWFTFLTDLLPLHLLLTGPDRRRRERGQTIRSLPGAAGSCWEVGGLSTAHAPSTSVATYVERGSVRQFFFNCSFKVKVIDWSSLSLRVMKPLSMYENGINLLT